jgi:hypothetical protein
VFEGGFDHRCFLKRLFGGFLWLGLVVGIRGHFLVQRLDRIGMEKIAMRRAQMKGKDMPGNLKSFTRVRYCRTKAEMAYGTFGTFELSKSEPLSVDNALAL